MFTSLKNYFIESYRELHRVTWLTRKQIISHTIIVLSVAFVVGVMSASVDFGFQSLYTYIVNNLL